LTFTSDARTDFGNLVSAHGDSLTLRARSVSSFGAESGITYSTSDSSITGVLIDNISEQELFNMAGKEVDADRLAMVEYDESVDENDQILVGTEVYDITEIIKLPDSTNIVAIILALKKVRP